MKKLIFLVIFFATIEVKAQDTISNYVEIVIPKTAKKINRSDFINHVHRNFKHYDEIEEKSSDYYKNSYKVDDVLIRFFDQRNSVVTPLTTQQKNILGQMARVPIIKVNFSKIISVNGIDFLILEYQTDDDVTINFMSEIRGHKRFAGELRFKQLDDKKAQKILDTLLSSVHFKR